MTLATVVETTRPHRLRASRRTLLGVDAFLMALSLAVCALLFTSGGLEALAGAAISAVVAARQAQPGQRVSSAYSGGFAGLFVGGLFAGFFHPMLITALQLN
jgi:hypothetical protein